MMQVRNFILFLTLMAAISASAQSTNVNQLINSQLLGTVSIDEERLPEVYFPISILNKPLVPTVSPELNKSVIIRNTLVNTPVSDIPHFVKQSFQNGKMAIKRLANVPATLNTGVIRSKLLYPHPNAFDIGNFVLISPGSWIRLNRQFSIILDLPMYFYSVNYSNSASGGIRDRLSITEKSFNRGEFLPLVYQVKIGMGIEF